MCKMSEFGHLLEIAVTLSAVFYFIELREFAEQRKSRYFSSNDALLQLLRNEHL